MEDQQIKEQTEKSVPDNEQNSGQYKLQHDRPNCIGCAACEAVAPDFWEMNQDGKSDIKNGKDNDNGWQDLNIEEKDYNANKDAADACPVNVIHIVKKGTGERLI